MVVVVASIEQLANRDVHGSNQDGSAPLARVLEAKGQDGRQLHCPDSVRVNPRADHASASHQGRETYKVHVWPQLEIGFCIISVLQRLFPDK
jgi:hypothetical protein